MTKTNPKITAFDANEISSSVKNLARAKKENVTC